MYHLLKEFQKIIFKAVIGNLIVIQNNSNNEEIIAEIFNRVDSKITKGIWKSNNAYQELSFSDAYEDFCHNNSECCSLYLLYFGKNIYWLPWIYFLSFVNFRSTKFT